MKKSIGFICLSCLICLMFFALPCQAKKLYMFDALTGGGIRAMDSVDGDELSEGDFAVVEVGGVVYHYRLNASSSTAESAPLVISPNTDPGTKRWELQRSYVQWVDNVYGMSETNTGAENAAILNAAILNSAGKVIKLPSGAYEITDITITIPGVIIEGNGWDQTILKAAAGTDKMFNIQAAWGTIKNLTLDGNAIANYGLYAEDLAFELTFDHVWVRGCTGTPGYGYFNVLRNYTNRFQSCRFIANKIGMVLQFQCQNTILSECVLHSNTTNQLKIGEGSATVRDVVLIATDIEYGTAPGNISNILINTVAPLTITGGYWESGSATSRDLELTGGASSVNIFGVYANGNSATQYSIKFSANGYVLVAGGDFVNYTVGVAEGVGSSRYFSQIHVDPTTATYPTQFQENIQVQNPATDGIATVSIKNDVQEWKLQTRGDESDAFVLRDGSNNEVLNVATDFWVNMPKGQLSIANAPGGVTDTVARLSLKNDAQEWQLQCNGATGGDALVIGDLTGSKAVLSIKPSGYIASLQTSNASIGTFTLTAGATSTFVSNTSVTGSAVVFLSPATASAAADFGSATGVYHSSNTGGAGFTVTHPNTADVDKRVNYWAVN